MYKPSAEDIIKHLDYFDGEIYDQVFYDYPAIEFDEMDYYDLTKAFKFIKEHQEEFDEFLKAEKPKKLNT